MQKVIVATTEDSPSHLPGPFGWLFCFTSCFCRSRVEGSSLRRRENCLLKGDVSLSFSNPRNEYWRSSIDSVACGRCTANGLAIDFTGTGSVETL